MTTETGPRVQVLTGGPYTRNKFRHEVNISLPDGEFTFTLYDSYGDGMCCSYGRGEYRLEMLGDRDTHHSESRSLLFEGGRFTAPDVKHIFSLPYLSQPSPPPAPPRSPIPRLPPLAPPKSPSPSSPALSPGLLANVTIFTDRQPSEVRNGSTPQNTKIRVVHIKRSHTLEAVPTQQHAYPWPYLCTHAHPCAQPCGTHALP